ncbi:hypothetical protein [Butyrivibrio sp. NC3005]|uniref:hypothetical protein n=1 Tax=Butyrivibrio sp. NC3005 TaxID=1280685 RepID=UPI000406CEA6|nr:hypothetical protein [Butyrivibrio sp. NC3005]
MSEISNISNISNTTTTSPVYEAAAKEQVAKDTVKDKIKEDAVETGVVYEKSSESSSKQTKTYKPNPELVEKLKKDQETRKQQLLDLVRKMFNQQATTVATANVDIKIPSEDELWKTLASGKFEVDEETKKQATEDISEDGYWGVNKTSERILDFANALTGGDPSKLQTMVDAFKKGYEQAEKTWGGKLPEISQKTYNAVMNGFKKLAEENGITLTGIEELKDESDQET